MTSHRLRTFTRWVFALTLASVIGFIAGQVIVATTPPPVDYRIQLPTLPIGDMP